MLGIGNKTNLNVGTNLNIINDIKQAFYKATIVEKIIYINVLLFLITALFTKFSIQWTIKLLKEKCDKFLIKINDNSS